MATVPSDGTWPAPTPVTPRPTGIPRWVWGVVGVAVLVIVVGVIFGSWVRDRRNRNRPVWIQLANMPRAYSPRVQARSATAAVAPTANSVASTATPPAAATSPGPTSLVAASPAPAPRGSAAQASPPAAAAALGAAAPTDNGGAPQAPNRDRVQRAQDREMAARRDARLRREATERAQRAAAIADDGQEDEGDQAFPFEVADVVSRSDDSDFDVVRRGPSVNPEYHNARILRYQQRLAEGYTHRRAMSVSEASTEDADWFGPLVVRARPTLNDGNNGSTSNSGPVAMPAPIHQFPQLSSVQLAPARVPDRWVSHSAGTVPAESGSPTPQPTSQNAEDGYHGGETSTETVPAQMLPARPETARLRQEADPRESWRMNQADVGRTESNDTTTRANTFISDDPWQSEAGRNRQRPA